MKEGSARDMIKMDITLKEEMLELFSKFLHRQTLNLVLASICTIGILSVIIFFMLRPSKVDSMIYNKIQQERVLLMKQRDSLQTLINEWLKIKNLK